MFTLKKMVKKTVTYSEDYFVVTKHDGNKNLLREFHDGPVVRTLWFHCKGRGFDLWSEN